MRTLPRFWADLATTDFAMLDRTRAIAVLPVATDLADGVVQASLPHLPADLPALFLPPQAVGYSPEHTAFAGTLTLRAETVIRLWTDIAESVAASGVKKLVLFNSHGGQVSLLDVVARALRADRVRMAAAQNFHSTSQDRAAKFPILGNGKSAKLAWQMQDYNLQGAAGNAAMATAEKGQALVQAAGRSLARLLNEIDQLPADTLR